MTRRFMPVALEKFQVKDSDGTSAYAPWRYESIGRFSPSTKSLPQHFVFNADAFVNTMVAYLSEIMDPGTIYNNFELLQNIGEALESYGPDTLDDLKDSPSRLILQHIGPAFGTAYAVQYSLESLWRHMGRNILEVDPLLMAALMRTQVNILPEDFQLPISPLYVAIPEGTLSVMSEDSGSLVDIDGFMAQILDYEKMPGDIWTFDELIDRRARTEGIDRSQARKQVEIDAGLDPEDAVYVDDFVSSLGNIALRGGHTRHLRINAYSSTPAGVSPAHVQFLYFVVPLNSSHPAEEYFWGNAQLRDLLEGSGSPQSPAEWGRAIFNPLLYFFSQGADKERESGLSPGQQKRLSKIPSKKQRQKFIDKHKSPYSIIKIGKSFSSSLSSGLKRGSIDKRFVVRGHWRLQRVGKSLSEIKTIWIQPYIKGKGKESLDSSRVYRNPCD